MIKILAATFLLSIWVLLIFPVITSAQSLNNNGPTLPYTGFGSDLNFWWLVPLALLPIALIVLSNNSNRNIREDISYQEIKRPRNRSSIRKKRLQKRR